MNTTIFTEVVANYTDNNDVLHIDGYVGDSNEGTTVAYIFNGCVYYANPDYQFDSLVRSTLEGLQLPS